MSRSILCGFALAVALVAGACDDPAPTAVPDGPGQLLSTAQTTLLVGFTSQPGDGQVALIQRLGGTVIHRFKYIPVLAVRLPASQEQVLANTPGVAYINPDQRLVAFGGRQITDYGVRLIDAPGAWAAGYRGQNVKVGIFDSGVDLEHPDLSVAGGIDLVGDGHGFDDCAGHGTHVAGIVGARNNGRHTVGVAPQVTLYSMRILDCEGSGSTTNMLIGLEWAMDNGIDVINMSFGVPLPTALDDAADAALQAAYDHGIVLIGASGNSSAPFVSYPAAHSAVIAVGATNDADLIAEFSQTGTDQELTAPGVNNLSSYPVGQGVETSLYVDTDADRELEAIALEFAGKTTKQGLRLPTVYAGVGTAADFAAVDCVGKTALVTRGGPSFAEKTVAAMNAGCAAIIIHNITPGNFNGTLGAATAPDGRAWIPAVSISLEEGLYLKEQIEAQATRTTLINANGNLAILSGTSMASPHAAGVAALILSKNPNLTPDQVRSILHSSALDLGTPGWDPVFGYGRIQARRAVELTQ